jgi:hypothetical protein
VIKTKKSVRDEEDPRNERHELREGEAVGRNGGREGGREGGRTDQESQEKTMRKMVAAWWTNISQKSLRRVSMNW